MRTPQQLLDGLGFAANTAFGLGRGLSAELKTLVEGKINRKLARMNLVTREEYDELRAMVAEMRQQQEKILGQGGDPAGEGDKEKPDSKK